VVRFIEMSSRGGEISMYHCPAIQRRRHLHELLSLLQQRPVVALLGPRQVGKTTLARMVLDEYSGAVDAHRPVLATENLDDIFTWQETRQVSQSLTFNYQRQLFLPEDTEATRTLAGKRLTVYELNDGTVQVRHDGKVLTMTSFAKEEAKITQGAIVSNKLLSGVLQQIKDKQATKDSENLAKARTKRDKPLLLQRIKATG